jgi:hypothetical protein
MGRKPIYFLLPILALFSGHVHAALIWDWKLVDNTVVVSPTQTIALNATLTNDASSSVALSGLDRPLALSFLALQGDFTQDKYSFILGPGPGNDFHSQFTGIVLLPGESFDFILGSYVPVEGGVTPGIYATPYLSLAITGAGYLGRSFQATVVPEPGTIYLFLSGIIIMLIRSRYFN